MLSGRLAPAVLGINRHTLPDGRTRWGNTGGFHGYHTWSYHSADARQQLTVSVTAGHRGPPDTAELLAEALTEPDQ